MNDVMILLGNVFSWGLFWLTGVGAGYLLHDMIAHPHKWFD